MDLDGILLVDKKEGHTSFETVQKARRILSVKKAGHAGTLDKFASGLLIVCLGRATSVQDIFMSGFKRYRATIRLGEETDTLDTYGRVVRTLEARVYTDGEISKVLSSFRGKTLQVPPQFSAIHVKGKRSYLRKLGGEDVELTPREIEVMEIDLAENAGRDVTFEVHASKGTYVRSLARDIAVALGTCGHLTRLRRLTIGSLSVDDAVSVDELEGPERVIGLGDALSALPSVEVEEEKALRIENGFPLERVFEGSELVGIDHRFVRVLSGGQIIALIEKKEKPCYFKVFKRKG